MLNNIVQYQVFFSFYLFIKIQQNIDFLFILFFFLANEQTVIVYAKSIQHKYISSDAEMCLNLPEALREEIEGNINNSNCPRTIFDEAQTLVYLDMENDIFPRFFYSPAGKKYLAKVLEEEKRKQQRISRLGALKTGVYFYSFLFIYYCYIIINM